MTCLATCSLETTIEVEGPRLSWIKGPYWRESVWNDFGMTEPIWWRWPIMGSDLGLGGGLNLELPFVVDK